MHGATTSAAESIYDNSRFPQGQEVQGPSAKQVEANRANAQKSTGPRTEAGKARSSQNALRHGLFSKVPILPGEDPRDFARLTVELFKTYEPRPGQEEFLVHRLVHKEWMLKRVRDAEVEMGKVLAEQGKTAARALAEDYMGIGSGGMLRMMNHELRISHSIETLRNKLAKLQQNRVTYCGDGINELTDYSEAPLRALLGGSDEPLDGSKPNPRGAGAACKNEAEFGAQMSAPMQDEPKSAESARLVTQVA